VKIWSEGGGRLERGSVLVGIVGGFRGPVANEHEHPAPRVTCDLCVSIRRSRALCRVCASCVAVGGVERGAWRVEEAVAGCDCALWMLWLFGFVDDVVE
jgi:hypothetical protein